MLRNLIEEIGTVRVAKACGVTPPRVSQWKRDNRLPNRDGAIQARSQRYEAAIAELAGISVSELRDRLKT